MKWLTAVVAAAAMLAVSGVAQARTLALLIGVAQYNKASGIHSLLGPRNDVSIIWRALKSRQTSREREGRHHDSDGHECIEANHACSFGPFGAVTLLTRGHAFPDGRDKNTYNDPPERTTTP